jgi:hypothetical protein
MKIGIYKATLTHDNGKIKLNVVSLSGKQGAIKQIMVSEKCPESAITKIKKLSPKSV